MLICLEIVLLFLSWFTAYDIYYESADVYIAAHLCMNVLLLLLDIPWFCCSLPLGWFLSTPTVYILSIQSPDILNIISTE